MRNLTSVAPKPHTDCRQNWYGVSTSATSTPVQNFIQIQLRVLPRYMRSCPRKWLDYFGGGFWQLYHLDACTDFDAQFVKWRRFAHRCAFWESREQSFFNTFTPFPTQSVDFASIFWRDLTWKNFSSKWALTLRVPRENDPYSWSYAFGSWMLNRQSGHSESKYVCGLWSRSRFHLDIAHARTWIVEFNPKSHYINSNMSETINLSQRTAQTHKSARCRCFGTVSRSKVKVKMSKVPTYFERYPNIYSDQATSISDQ